MEILLTQCQLAVSDLPQFPGGKLLQFLDPSGIKVSIPLNAEAAALICNQLRQTIVPARNIFPAPNGG